MNEKARGSALLVCALAIFIVSVLTVGRAREDIVDLIDESYVVGRQACFEANLDNQASMLATLAPLWSHRTPEPDAVSTLQVQWSFEATAGVPDRQQLANQIDRIELAIEAGKTNWGDATTIAELQNWPATTPDWSPNQSPFEQRVTHIEQCQDDLGKNGALISETDVVVALEDIKFFGTTEAFVSVRIDSTIQLRTSRGISDPTTQSHRYTALVAREGASWVLLRLGLVLEP